ncbi:unnamed protein product, partial [marine sediment metagenome]
AGEKATETSRADLAETALRNVVGVDKLKDALGAAGVKPELISQAAILLQPQVKVEMANGTPTVSVLDESGGQMFAEGGGNATLADLATSFTAANAHFVPPSGDGGSGQHKGGAGSDGITQAALLADPNKHNEWMQGFPPGESGAAFAKLPRK